VRVHRAWTPLLKTGVALMTVGAAMTLAGNLAILGAFNGESSNGAAAVAVITFGWALGPLTHIVGIGLMGGALGELRDANRLQPNTLVPRAPEARGLGITLRF
jgi:hypothetical protein